MEMGNSEDHGKAQIPIINFPKEIVGLDHEQGSTTGGEEWKGKSGKMREAFEKYGCFILKCEENIPNYNMTTSSSSSSSCSSSREQIFMASKALFDLPDETKQKHTSSKPYRSYAANCPAIPLSESFGIDNGSSFDAVQSFTYLMWPQGNKAFCESVSYMAKKMSDLSFMILRMMLESLGMEKHYKSHVEGTSTVLRLMKYRVGPASADSVQLGLLAHTDKSALTILCQNEVQGLELLTKQGTWLQVQLPEASFIVFVGDALKAWSNGRLHAATHRVMLKGDKDRYSCGLFLVPKEEVTIEVPQELIDKEHPLLYRPFKFSDYFSYFVSNCTEDALEIYAGV